jgi:hypothetical protein
MMNEARPRDQQVEKAMQLSQQLIGVERCPHCGIAMPTLMQEWHSNQHVPRATPGPKNRWAVYRCTGCGGIVAAKGEDNGRYNNDRVIEFFPSPKKAHEDIPEVARRFLQQAYETLHAPDAAAMVAGSAVDAMLKHHGYTEGSLYTRIDQAVEKHLLTKAMGDWAHEVRLGSNRPRHADKEAPHVSPEEAQQSVEFAEALANFLFVLQAKIDRGIQKAKEIAP